MTKKTESRAEPSLPDLMQAMLAEEGITLTESGRILDLGCGDGRHVYGLRDRGFTETCGFDILDYVTLRAPGDAAFFRFSEGKDFHVPYPDGSFDFIYSHCVLEHVRDHDAFLSETARLLSPRGVSLHLFPAKYRPIEPHIFVPFAGVIQSPTYLRFWARMRIRNSFQRQDGLNVDQIAEANWQYCRDGIHYLPNARIEKMARAHFSRVSFVEANFIRNSRGRSNRILAPLLPMCPWIAPLFRAVHTVALLLKL